MHGPMAYAIVFLAAGGGLTALAAAIGGPAWLLLWPAAASWTVAAAYLGLGPGVFGKRPDGTVAWPARLLLWPYLSAAWVLWRLHRLLGAGRCCDEVADGLWLGRRPYHDELPAGVSLVVDLTSEFAEPRAVLAKAAYRCLPTLDASAPPQRAFLELVREVASWEGCVYVHCANGRGRSATAVAAVLMARGSADNVEQAMALLKKARPKTNLSRPQMRLLQKLERKFGSDERE